MSNNKELKDEQLEKVNGGSGNNSETDLGLFHNECGGRLLNVNNPFLYVKCAKCNESHYLTSSFDRYQIYKTVNYGLRYYHSGSISYYAAVDNIARPEELDEPCNMVD